MLTLEQVAKGRIVFQELQLIVDRSLSYPLGSPERLVARKDALALISPLLEEVGAETEGEPSWFQTFRRVQEIVVKELDPTRRLEGTKRTVKVLGKIVEEGDMHYEYGHMEKENS